MASSRATRFASASKDVVFTSRLRGDEMGQTVRALSYGPKIDACLRGAVTQTIRRGRRHRVGDRILFHGWFGRPYRSPWSWRMDVELVDVIPMDIIDGHPVIEGVAYSWDDARVHHIARLDGIDPPTGPALRDVLASMHSPLDGEYQILTWAWPPVELSMPSDPRYIYIGQYP